MAFAPRCTVCAEAGTIHNDNRDTATTKLRKVARVLIMLPPGRCEKTVESARSVFADNTSLASDPPDSGVSSIWLTIESGKQGVRMTRCTAPNHFHKTTWIRTMSDSRGAVNEPFYSPQRFVRNELTS